LLDAPSTLRIKVVDGQGRPIGGARGIASRWGGYARLRFRGETDAGGRLTWQSAPRDAVAVPAEAKGVLTQDELWLRAVDEEQTVSLHATLVVSGRVIDGKTFQPVGRFKLSRGYRSIVGPLVWSPAEWIEHAEGRYSFEPGPDRKLIAVRIESSGYRTAQ